MQPRQSVDAWRVTRNLTYRTTSGGQPSSAATLLAGAGANLRLCLPLVGVCLSVCSSLFAVSPASREVVPDSFVPDTIHPVSEAATAGALWQGGASGGPPTDCPVAQACCGENGKPPIAMLLFISLSDFYPS